MMSRLVLTEAPPWISRATVFDATVFACMTVDVFSFSSFQLAVLLLL